VRFEADRQEPASLDIGWRDLLAPPLVRDRVRHHRKHEIHVLRTVAWIQESEPLAIFDGRGRTLHSANGRILNQSEITVRVRAKLPRVQVERGSYASHHALQCPGMPWVMEDLNGDSLP